MTLPFADSGREWAVVICTDRSMFLPAISVASDAAKHAESYDVVLLVDSGGIPAGFPAWHRARGTPFRVVEFDFGKWVPEALQANERFPRAAELRLVLTKYLAGRYRRILFLDADLWLRWPLSGLFHLDLGGAALAASSSFDMSPLTPDGEYLRKGMPPHPARLGFPKGRKYLNAGTMLIDTDEWDRRRISERAIDFIIAHREACTYLDQDGINAAVGGEYAELSPGWSRHPNHLKDRKGHYRIDPLIYHYYGDEKPWGDVWNGEAIHADHFRDFFAGLWPDAVAETGLWQPRQRSTPKPPPSLPIRVARRLLPDALRYEISRFLGRIPASASQRLPHEEYALIAAYLRDTPFVDVVQGVAPRPFVGRRYRRAT